MDNSFNIKRLDNRKIKITDALQRVGADEAGKFDFKTNLKDIKLQDDGNLLIPDISKGNVHIMPATNTARSQLFTNMLGIPSDYAAKVPVELLRPHFEYFQEKTKDREILVRARGDEESSFARAFLSDSYDTSIGNFAVMRSLHDTILNLNEVYDARGTLVEHLHADEDMLNARIIFDDLGIDTMTAPGGKANRFIPGIHVTNGETGNYAASVELIIFEQWCSNGMVRRFSSGSLFRKRHITKLAHEDLVLGMTESISLARTYAKETMECFMESMNKNIKHPTEVIEEICARRRDAILKTSQPVFLQEYENRPNANLYGVVSALTKTAQSYSFDRRLKMETVAGDLIMGKMKI